jgi:hypothetical protein
MSRVLDISVSYRRDTFVTSGLWKSNSCDRLVDAGRRKFSSGAPYGAISTCLHAAGRSAIVSGGRGLAGSFGGGGLRIDSWNQ